MSSISSPNLTVFITPDKQLPKGDKKIVTSTLEKLIEKYKSLGEVQIPIHFSDEHEPYMYFPYYSNHHVNSQIYIDKYACKNKNGVDADSLIANVKRGYMRYDPHIHIFIINPPAYDLRCYEMILGRVSPIIPPALPSYEEGAIFETPGVVVVSVGSFKKRYGRDWPTALYGTLAYYLGFLFGLPAYENPNRKGLHCLYEYCVMRGISDKEGLDRILKNNPNLYCEHDLWYLRKNLQILFG
jgi:hypothetical protein